MRLRICNRIKIKAKYTTLRSTGTQGSCDYSGGPVSLGLSWTWHQEAYPSSWDNSFSIKHEIVFLKSIDFFTFISQQETFTFEYVKKFITKFWDSTVRRNNLVHLFYTFSGTRVRKFPSSPRRRVALLTAARQPPPSLAAVSANRQAAAASQSLADNPRKKDPAYRHDWLCVHELRTVL